MNKVKLGNTDIYVSRLCFGGLTIGPLQAGLSIEHGSEVISYAFNRGVNFIDTAQLYRTYEYIKEAIKKTHIDPVISTKSYAYSKEGAKSSFVEAQKALDRDYIDIFMLHEQESIYTLRGHREALEYYIELKQQGKIRAVGVSTHNIEVVEAASEMDEIDIIHPLINIKGIGIGDGTIDEMLKAVKKAHNAGKGIYSMKPLGGGSLLNNYNESLKFVLNNKSIDSVAIGMRTIEEAEMNINVFENKTINKELIAKVAGQNRKLHIEFWCENCGKCVKRCKQNALKTAKDKVEVNMNKCVLCGYCCSVCPQFAIKIF